MSPHFGCMASITVAMHLASVIIQNVPRGRVRATHFFTHVDKSALWWALCAAGVPLKYGGLVTTKSNVRSVRQLVMSVLINSNGAAFSSAFFAHADNMSVEVSRPVIVAAALCACRHNATPPVPTPTSKIVWAGISPAIAASQTASDVGL